MWEVVEEACKDATCDEDGKNVYRCIACEEGYEEEEIVEKTGHTPEYHTAIEPTCTLPGVEEYFRCATCGMYFADEECTTATEIKLVEAKGHTPKYHEANEPQRCNDPDGNIEYWECSVCGLLFADEACTTEITEEDTVKKAPEHKIVGFESKPATCTEDGYDSTDAGYCTVCGTYVAPVVIKALGHEMIDVTYYYTEADGDGSDLSYKCTSGGYTAKVCATCGYEEDYKEFEPKGHEYTAEWVCTSLDKASFVYTCTVCGKSIDPEDAPSCIDLFLSSESALKAFDADNKEVAVSQEDNVFTVAEDAAVILVRKADFVEKLAGTVEKLVIKVGEEEQYLDLIALDESATVYVAVVVGKDAPELEYEGAAVVGLEAAPVEEPVETAEEAVEEPAE